MSELSNTEAMVNGADSASPNAAYWLAEIATAKRFYEKWQTRGDKVIKRYKDENSARDEVQNTRGRKMAILWSNVQTVKPALYSKTPQPNISRRNKDGDPVGRVASIVLERAVNACMARQDFDQVLSDCVLDLLLPGKGELVAEYKADIDGDAVSNQRAELRYVHWRDCLTNPARLYSEVWWFGNVAYPAREEVAKTFGEEVAAKIQYDHVLDKQDGNTPDSQPQADKRATVWTIWSKRHRRVFQVSPGFPDGLLGDMAPPVDFADFFPNPRPLLATTAHDSILPVPDFALYQDQADAIDLLTNKIYKLSESLRLRGLYPADMDAVKRLLQDASDTEMIPVESWAVLQERGGADGLVAWFPLKDVAAALVASLEALEKQKAMMYEVTGLSDIIRGASEASETATAQQIKTQWGSLRIRDRQRDIQRFARDAIRKMAEIVAEHFNQDTLAAMSGLRLLTKEQKAAVLGAQQMIAQQQQQAQQAQAMGQPAMMPQIPQPSPEMLEAAKQPTWDEVMGLLRNDKLRGFVIDVETDSTIEPDQQAEQQKAVMFIEGMTQFLTAATPIIQAAPIAAPMLAELMLFGARRFKIGETIESKIEQFAEAVVQQASQPQPPNPQVQVAQIKAKAEEQKANNEVRASEIDMQGKILDHQHKTAEHAMDMQALAVQGQAQQQQAAIDQQRMAQQAAMPQGAPQ